MSGTGESFTCDNCGETFSKTRSDEEAEAEAQELFPGIDVSDPEEAGVVCDDCFNRIMARVQEEAPELIGEGWRGDGIPTSVVSEPQPIPDFLGFVEQLTAEKGYGLNPCPDHCPYRDADHAHLRTPAGSDFIIWAYGRYSSYDLTQPAELVYPIGRVRNTTGQVLAYDMVLPKWIEEPAWTPFRDNIPRATSCYRMGNGSMVHVKPGCRCPR